MKTQHYSLARSTLVALFLIGPFTVRMNGQNVGMQWVQRFNFCTSCTHNTNDAKKVGLDAQENVYVGGLINESATDMNWAVVKYSPTGLLLGQARYGGAAGGFDTLYDMKVDKDGSVYATGTSIENGNQSIYTTVKYNSNLVQQWVAHYSGSSGYSGYGLAITSDSAGNSYVTGTSIEGSGVMATIKYNSAGVQQWVTLSNFGTSQACQGIVTDANGNVYVTGGFWIDAQNYNCVTIKYNSQGVEQWHRIYNGPLSQDSGIAITLDAAANAYVIGLSKSHGAGGDYFDYLTIKYNTAGDQIWVARYDGPVHRLDEIRAMVYDPATSSVVVTGTSYDSVSSNSVLTIKYDAVNGGAIWTARYIGVLNSDAGNAITADSSGNIYVTGAGLGVGTGNDFVTLKYDQNGVQKWAVRYDGAGGQDYGYSIKVGPLANNVYVTGPSAGLGTFSEYATIKYVQTGP